MVPNYKPLGLTQNISKNNVLLVKYLYLADGMKTSAQHSDGSGLVYRGPDLTDYYDKSGNLILHVEDGR